VKGWTTLKAVFVVDVRGLDDLKKIADACSIPYIVSRKKEYLVFQGMSVGGVPIVYRYKG